MLRRHRIRLIRLGVAALAVVALAAILIPASSGSSHAATPKPATIAKAPPTAAELQAAVTLAGKHATAARNLADKQQLAAAKADANLLQAALTLSTLRATNALHPPAAPAFGAASDYAVQAAQSQLRLAQQNQQMAEMRAAPLQLPSATPGNALSAALNTSSQMDVQNAQQAVATAQQALAAAQVTATQVTLTAAIGATADTATLHNATLQVTTARRLAEAAERVAQAAELNAQSLAETADRARTAAAL
jgi:hypothetical protein